MAAEKGELTEDNGEEVCKKVGETGPGVERELHINKRALGLHLIASQGFRKEVKAM